MSERTAWILTFVFGGSALVVVIIYIITLVNYGTLDIGLTGGMIALIIVTGVFFRRASYLRTQRVVSDRADQLDGRETDVDAAREFYGDD